MLAMFNGCFLASHSSRNYGFNLSSRPGNPVSSYRHARLPPHLSFRDAFLFSSVDFSSRANATNPARVFRRVVLVVIVDHPRPNREIASVVPGTNYERCYRSSSVSKVLRTSKFLFVSPPLLSTAFGRKLPNLFSLDDFHSRSQETSVVGKNRRWTARVRSSFARTRKQSRVKGIVGKRGGENFSVELELRLGGSGTFPVRSEFVSFHPFEQRRSLSDHTRIAERGKYHFPRSNIWASPNKRISVLSLRRASTSTPRFSGFVCCVNEDSRETHTHTHIHTQRERGDIRDRRSTRRDAS